MKIVLFLLFALFLVTLANPTADVGDCGCPEQKPKSSSVSTTDVGNLTKKTSEKTIQIKNQVRILPSSNGKI